MTMTDTSDKPLQKALEILEVAALTHDDFTASDTCAAAFAFVKAQIEADASALAGVARAVELLKLRKIRNHQLVGLVMRAIDAREQVER